MKDQGGEDPRDDSRDDAGDKAVIYRAYEKAAGRLAEGEQAGMLTLRKDQILTRDEFIHIKLGIEMSLVEFYERKQDKLKVIRHLYQACRIQKDPDWWVKLYELCRSQKLIQQAEYAVREAQRIVHCPQFNLKCNIILAEILFLRGQTVKARFEKLQQCEPPRQNSQMEVQKRRPDPQIQHSNSQPQPQPQPQSKEKLLTKIVIQTSTWPQLIQSLYLMYRVLSLEQKNEKYSKLQEACKGLTLLNTLIAFQLSAPPNPITFLLEGLRLKLFVRRSKLKFDLKKMLRISTCHDQQPIALSNLKDCHYSIKHAALVRTVQRLYQQLDPRCAESPLQDLLQSRAPQLQQYHPRTAQKEGLQGWLKDRPAARPPLQWAEDSLRLFLANKLKGDQVVPHEMLQDFDCYSFRVLVVKLFRRAQAAQPGVALGPAQKLTLLQLLWDLAPQFKSKWGKSNSWAKQSRHDEMMQSLLSDLKTDFLKSDLAGHPYMCLRMFLTELILRPHETQEQSFKALKNEMGLAGSLSFFWLKTVVGQDLRETLAERGAVADEVRRVGELHRGTLQELSFQLLAKFHDRVVRRLDWTLTQEKLQISSRGFPVRTWWSLPSCTCRLR